MLNMFDRPHADSSMLPLATGPWPIFSIVAVYLLFVLKLGRKIMANREPFQLRRALQVYNIVQIVFNASICTRGIYFLFVERPYDFSCMNSLSQEHHLKSIERLLCYAYYLNKILDLLDTVFFILRKSYKQITVLHVYHHVLMTVSTYMVIRFAGYGGHPCIMGMINTFVHVVMYSYYYLASQNKDIKKSIWWKKYITIIQEVQFIIIFGHTIWTINQPDCNTPRSVLYLCASMSLVMMIMFINFYIHSYILRPKLKSSDKVQ